MVSSLIRYFVGVVFVISLSSCNHNEAYYKFTSIPQNEWDKQSQICFNLDSISTNTSNGYNVSLEITHNISYPYKNLFLYLDYIRQDSILSLDTLELTLADDYGKWQGGGNGPTRHLSVLYKSNFKVDTTLHNEIRIGHAMQDQKLKGIERIGLKVY